ncbi:MAG: hypothetical protein HYS12_17575 [Planctomycetes bacterium]|nr:hypothetical protein [Planctomycetota bacterium]
MVLVLGSSRTAYGLDARRLSEAPHDNGALVFNFGIAGSGPLFQLVGLRRLLDEGVRPDLLYVEVIPALLSDYDGSREERLLDGARLRLGEVRSLRPSYRHPGRLLGGWLLGRLLPCYRHQAEVRGCLGVDVGGSDSDLVDGYGWRPWHNSGDDGFCRRQSDLAHRQYQPLCVLSNFATGQVQALEDFLALCRREKIPVRLLLMPEAKPFRDLYSPAAREAFATLMGRMRSEWGVPVVDARDWVDDTEFWDTHHLFDEGARCFTDRFGREALRPALEELARIGKTKEKRRTSCRARDGHKETDPERREARQN